MLLSPVEHRILKAMLERRRFMTTGRISGLADISWNTADKYLRYFYREGWVDRRKFGNRVYWKAIIKME